MEGGGKVEERRPPRAVVVATPTPPAEVCEDDPRVRACRVHTAASQALPLDLAAGHGSIALLYTELDLRDPHREPHGPVSFLLHDRELEPIGEARIRVAGSAIDVSLVATAEGWLAAVETREALHILTLDPQGQEFGERRMIAEAGVPRLQADGPRAPLLAWSDRDSQGFMAQALPPRGSLSPVLKLFERTTEPNFGGQIAVAPGEFLVARRSDRGVAVRRLSARGELRSHHADVGSNTEYPTLALCDDGPRMVWSDFENRGEIRWARLHEDGALDGEMVRLSGVPDHFNHSPAVCDGVDTLVLLAGYTGGTGLSKSLDLVRVDERGQITGEPLRLYAGPDSFAYDPTMLRDDDALFVAWGIRGEPGRIALKRIDLAAAPKPALGR